MWVETSKFTAKVIVKDLDTFEINQSASPLKVVEEGQPMHFMIGLWSLIRMENWAPRLPPSLS